MWSSFPAWNIPGILSTMTSGIITSSLPACPSAASTGFGHKTLLPIFTIKCNTVGDLFSGVEQQSHEHTCTNLQWRIQKGFT